MRTLVYLLIAGLTGCGSVQGSARPAANGAPLPLYDRDGGSWAVLGSSSMPSGLTLVGPAGTCESAIPLMDGAIDGVRAVEVGGACSARVALEGELTDARLIPLRFETMPSGRGRVGSAEGWTVRLAYGPEEDGCPGMPLHVQVKFGRQPVLRQNVWFTADDVHLLTAGGRAWLLLAGRGRAETIPLGHDGVGQQFDLPISSESAPCQQGIE